MAEAGVGRPISRRGFVLGAVACTFATFVCREADAEPAIAPLLGTFRFVGGVAEKRALNRAIERAVADVSFLFRGTARDRLRYANPIPEKLVLAADDERFSLAYKRERFTAPLDGKKVKVKSSTGQAMWLRLVRGAASIDQIFATDSGTRTNRLTPIDSGIVVDVTVRAHQLSRPVSYRLTYHR
jgi:hypothetical protein